MSAISPVNGAAVHRRSRPRRAALPVVVRELTLEDIPAVFALGQRLFTPAKLPTLYRAWDEDELVQLYTTDRETCLVAEAGGRVVGFAPGQMMEKPRSAWRYGWLEWLGVDRGLKRRGVATRLLRQLTSRFIEREARIMLVDTDERNRAAAGLFSQARLRSGGAPRLPVPQPRFAPRGHRPQGPAGRA